MRAPLACCAALLAAAALQAQQWWEREPLRIIDVGSVFGQIAERGPAEVAAPSAGGYDPRCGFARLHRSVRIGGWGLF
ncbi:MAG: hypothetical protein AAB225_04335 [Acidobacteriota bacterium]